MPTVYANMATVEVEKELERHLTERSALLPDDDRLMFDFYDQQVFLLEQELLERGFQRCLYGIQSALEEAAKIRAHMAEGKDTLTIGGGSLPLTQVLDICDQAAERYQQTAAFKQMQQYILGMSA